MNLDPILVSFLFPYVCAATSTHWWPSTSCSSQSGWQNFSLGCWTSLGCTRCRNWWSSLPLTCRASPSRGPLPSHSFFPQVSPSFFLSFFLSLLLSWVFYQLRLLCVPRPQYQGASPGSHNTHQRSCSQHTAQSAFCREDPHSNPCGPGKEAHQIQG